MSLQPSWLTEKYIIDFIKQSKPSPLFFFPKMLLERRSTTLAPLTVKLGTTRKTPDHETVCWGELSLTSFTAVRSGST